MSQFFRELFKISAGVLRTHHVFIDVDKFTDACHSVPIQPFIGDYILQSRTTKKSDVYWYEDAQGNKTPESPLRVIAKANFYLKSADWQHKALNPVFKKEMWPALDKYILSQDDYVHAGKKAKEDSHYHLIELVAHTNNQLRRFSQVKKEHSFNTQEDVVVKLLEIWYRTLQKQAVSHMLFQGLDIKDPSVFSRVDGVMKK